MKLFDPGKISLKKEYSIGERNFLFYQKKKKNFLKLMCVGLLSGILFTISGRIGMR
jgi:hypothetical protein